MRTAICRSQSSSPNGLQRFRHEALVWSSLSHKYILPLLGVSIDVHCGPCMVAPYMSNGRVARYIRTMRQRGQVVESEFPSFANHLVRTPSFLHMIAKQNQQTLYLFCLQLQQTAVALSYLHSQKVVHGDLRGVSPFL